MNSPESLPKPDGQTRLEGDGVAVVHPLTSGSKQAFSEQELRGIVDAISQTIVVLSPDGRGLYANRPLLDYTGLTVEQLMTPDLRGNPAFFHPEDWARLQDERRQGLARSMVFLRRS